MWVCVVAHLSSCHANVLLNACCNLVASLFILELVLLDPKVISKMPVTHTTHTHHFVSHPSCALWTSSLGGMFATERTQRAEAAVVLWGNHLNSKGSFHERKNVSFH